MRENINTVLLGPSSVLVPYAQHHVPKYHEWMEDPELRMLTASERLTLQEEYNMQQTWQKDDDKLTFIILSRHPGDGLGLDDIHLSPEDPRIASLPMVGDVNLFLKGVCPSVVSGSNQGEDDFEVEVEIMIADRAFRRKQLATEALLLLLTYTIGQGSADREIAHSNLQPYLDHIQATQSPKSLTSVITPDRLVARISDSNEPSICLFEKLGFRVVRRVQVFHEVEMRWRGGV